MTPADLPKLLGDYLRTQAALFAAVSSHGTIIGTAREIALIEFVRGLLPKRFEVLSGAIAPETRGVLGKAANQLDVMVVDTFEYPPLLRTGDLAVVLAPSVLAVVESKSDLASGEPFREAMAQIGRAKLVAGPGTLTGLFCFGAPGQSSTLRTWLVALYKHREALRSKAAKAPLVAPKALPKGKKKVLTRDQLIDRVSLFSPTALPNVIASDDGAIAIKDEAHGKTLYRFYKSANASPPVVALASSMLRHIALVSAAGGTNAAASTRAVTPLATSATPSPASIKILIENYESGFEASGDDDLDVTDRQPKPKKVAK